MFLGRSAAKRRVAVNLRVSSFSGRLKDIVLNIMFAAALKAQANGCSFSK